jgi:hypothetical protein
MEKQQQSMKSFVSQGDGTAPFKQDRQSQRKTFGLDSPFAYMAKLRWEYERLLEIDESQIGHTYQTLNAAITAWQMSDWVFAALSPGQVSAISQEVSPREQLKQFKLHLQDKYLALRICSELADAGKHRFLDRVSDPLITTRVFQFEEASGREIARWGIQAYGSSWNPAAVIHDAISDWERLLKEWGLHE